VSQKGFTLIELVMVIVILAILGGVAIPQFVNLQNEARTSNQQGVVGGVRAGILTFFIDPARGNRAAFPATLDGAANGACTVANACFTTVLAQGGVTEQWTKLTATTYRSSVNATNVWTYTPATGTFVQTTA
jgi:prepilin-type N-terminal cleavage/methylation domain-containing protein